MQIKKDNYIRAFSFKNLGCLFIDCGLSWYRRRNFLAVSQDGMCDQYFEKDTVEKTLLIGKDLFSSEENFKIFENGFRQGIKETEELIKQWKKVKSITLNDFFDLRAQLIKMFYFFEKTEFLFTDKCYVGEMSEILKKNLLILGDDLKVKARPLMVELLTTIPYLFTELLAKVKTLNPEDLKFYTLDEITTLMERNLTVPESEIKERQESFVFYCKDESIKLLNKEEKQAVLREFKNKDKTNLKEFKGTIANKGKVVAKVRVIIPELDQDYNIFIKKLLQIPMEEGEILVTETTSPDFVPLMKKAAGIIANQGGMNSHAAIMSRELKVPCLVATYHATEILKTGDIVELDAFEGVVKIIEKNK